MSTTVIHGRPVQMLTRRALGRAHVPPTKLFPSSHGSQWIKPFWNHASLQRQAPNTYTWDFPNVIKFRVATHTISEKAIRFWHPDYNPDRAQKLISSPMSRHLSTCNIYSKSVHAFLTNLASRQTDRQTDKRVQTHLPLPLSEVNYSTKQCLKWKIRGEGTVRQLWASKQVVLAPNRFLLSLRCGNAGSQ